MVLQRIHDDLIWDLTRTFVDWCLPYYSETFDSMLFLVVGPVFNDEPLRVCLTRFIVTFVNFFTTSVTSVLGFFRLVSNKVFGLIQLTNYILLLVGKRILNSVLVSEYCIRVLRVLY